MIGAIAGDVIGSVYEFDNMKSTDFELFGPGSDFTDDTVMTVAVADCILHGGDYAKTLKKYGRAYPGAGYGGMFARWLGSADSQPYNSYGNGSAMRVSPVGFAFGTMEETLAEAKRSAEVTHNHPEGIKGAQAVAASMFLARQGKTKGEIKQYVTMQFDYNLDQTLDQIRPRYQFDETCQGSVPQAIIAFLESSDYEDAIRKAVSLGGDSDTIACIAGGIAEAFYRTIPAHIVEETLRRLDKRLLAVLDEFEAKYGVTAGGGPDVRRPVNTYWVKPGQLLAGEYPGDKDEKKAVAKLKGLMDSGVDCFVDLTVANESGFKPYAQLLPLVFGSPTASYERFPIVDVDVPSSKSQMVKILDAIDGALKKGDTVYVHCRGGVGRTGTVVGCYLARHGLSGDKALAEVQRLWKGCDKSATNPRSPETKEQREYVRGWDG